MRRNAARLYQIIANFSGKRDIEKRFSVQMAQFPFAKPVNLVPPKRWGPEETPSQSATVC